VHTHPRLGDILANAITHGIGAVLALVGAVYLIAVSLRGTAWQAISCAVFAATLVLVYLCSTLYHSLVRTRARHVFHVLDHSSIYLLIAGTYTPFTLVSLRGLESFSSASPLTASPWPQPWSICFKAGLWFSRPAPCSTPSAGTG